MTLEAKLGIGAIILAIIGALGWLVYHENTTIRNDAVVNAQQKDVIDTQHTTIDMQASSAVITDTATATAASDVHATEQTQAAITKSADTQVQQVIQKYQAQPKPSTPAAVAQQQTSQEQDISRIQVTSLWQSYCEAKPSDAQCAAIAKAN